MADDDIIEEEVNLENVVDERTYKKAMEVISGVKKADVSEVSSMIKRIKSLTKTPVVSGFGIQNPDDARLITKSGCDGGGHSEKPESLPRYMGSCPSPRRKLG